MPIFCWAEVKKMDLLFQHLYVVGRLPTPIWTQLITEIILGGSPLGTPVVQGECKNVEGSSRYWFVWGEVRHFSSALLVIHSIWFPPASLSLSLDPSGPNRIRRYSPSHWPSERKPTTWCRAHRPLWYAGCTNSSRSKRHQLYRAAKRTEGTRFNCQLCFNCLALPTTQRGGPWISIYSPETDSKERYPKTVDTWNRTRTGAMRSGVGRSYTFAILLLQFPSRLPLISPLVSSRPRSSPRAPSATPQTDCLSWKLPLQLTTAMWDEKMKTSPQQIFLQQACRKACRGR